MAENIRGLELAKKFYEEILNPLLSDIPHSSALLGPGSEILGYDDKRSTDHDWGPRALIFASEEDVQRIEQRINKEGALPSTFAGWSTSMGRDFGPMTHHTYVSTFEQWFEKQFGISPEKWNGSLIDWLFTPQQRLLGMTKGIIFRDLEGKIAAKRREMEWYPDAVWWWMMACQWQRIGQEEAFVQRTSEVNDEAGSAIVAARITRDLMKLALLQSRKYAPYSKWLGTAFARSEQERGGNFKEIVEAILHSNTFLEREASLCKAYHELATRHNQLAQSDLSPNDQPYWDRPARVISAGRFVQDCLRKSSDSNLPKSSNSSNFANLGELALFGSVDQFIDSTDVLENPIACRALSVLYVPHI